MCNYDKSDIFKDLVLYDKKIFNKNILKCSNLLYDFRHNVLNSKSKQFINNT